MVFLFVLMLFVLLLSSSHYLVVAFLRFASFHFMSECSCFARREFQNIENVDGGELGEKTVPLGSFSFCWPLVRFGFLDVDCFVPAWLFMHG